MLWCTPDTEPPTFRPNGINWWDSLGLFVWFSTLDMLAEVLIDKVSPFSIKTVNMCSGIPWLCFFLCRNLRKNPPVTWITWRRMQRSRSASHLSLSWNVHSHSWNWLKEITHFSLMRSFNVKPQPTILFFFSEVLKKIYFQNKTMSD